MDQQTFIQLHIQLHMHFEMFYYNSLHETGAFWRNCGDESVNHTHVFWKCPILDNFWREIFDSLDKIFSSQLPSNPLLEILGALPETEMNRKKTYLLHILLTAARKAITLNWL